MRFLCPGLVFFLLFSCIQPKKGNAHGAADSMANSMGKNMADSMADNMGDIADRLSVVMRNAELPPAMSAQIQAAANRDTAFFDALYVCLAEDCSLRQLVDKQHPLPPDYIPVALAALNGGPYQLGRPLTLRTDAADSLYEMALAARSQGVTLVVSSAYRSYDYQEQVYSRIVREMGQEAADRESARPGHSQHQTGLVADFGSIDDSFARSDAGLWMAANAARFGWSLSYPDGYETVTGYRWESWHYRYVGINLAAFIENYFNGIQHYALRFLYEWSVYQ